MDTGPTQRHALRRDDVLTYLHGDHLGSASLATTAQGGVISEMRYYPYGETRSGDLPTDRRYTGQRWEDDIGLYDYNARYYNPTLARFISADTIVPEPGNPQDFNRYSYTRNNPLRYTDPTGHYILLEDDFGVRITDEGGIQIVQGGHRFANQVEMALANAILSGNLSHGETIVSRMAPRHIRRSLANVLAELGYRESGSRVTDLLFDPVLVAGLAMIAGKSIEDGAGSAMQWLGRVPSRYRASVAQAFEGTPTVEALNEDLIVYRRWGGGASETRSPWFSAKPYVRPGNARRYLALPDYNTAKNVSAFRIPVGTTIIRGKVASQVGTTNFGPYAVGGGTQIYLPNPNDAILIGPIESTR